MWDLALTVGVSIVLEVDTWYVVRSLATRLLLRGSWPYFSDAVNYNPFRRRTYFFDYDKPGNTSISVDFINSFIQQRLVIVKWL